MNGNGVRLPDLAAFVRTARKRPTAAAPTGSTRQQLATAVHTSIGYIAKIEQGEALHPSPAVVDALGAALALDDDELSHLYRLAGHSAPARADNPRSESVLRQTLDALAPHPAAVVNDRFDILSANDALEPAFPGLHRAGNMLQWLFHDPHARLVLEHWEHEAASAVRGLRHYAARPHDPQRLRSLIEHLAEHPDFHRLWTSGRIEVARPDPLVHLRNPRTGAVYSAHLQQFRTVETNRATRVLVCLLTDIAAAQ